MRASIGSPDAADALPGAEPSDCPPPGGSDVSPLRDVAFGPTPSVRSDETPLLSLPAHERLPEPESNERPQTERKGAILRRAQEAYDVHHYAEVVRLLETQPADDHDPEPQNLLESARFSLDQIQWLSQNLFLPGSRGFKARDQDRDRANQHSADARGGQ